MNLGPDAARLWLAGDGVPVPRPFHLRVLLPALCGQSLRRWWAVWGASWALVAAGMLSWRLAAGDAWQVAVAATALLVGLPGVLGPKVTIPVGVDLPALGLGLMGVAALEVGWWPVALVVFGVAAATKESAPVWAALWAWSLVPLVALVVPAVVAIVRRPGPDPLGPQFQRIADRPILTAWEHHRGRWRDGRLWVAPWGLALVGLVGMDWRLGVVLLVAHLQTLIATDTVRLVQTAAGPALVVAAAHVIPVEWLVLACVLHVFWFWKVERV